MFSCTGSSSTSFLIYRILEKMLGTQAITRSMAESLYVGMMTDTGNFSFSFLTPELYRAVAVLVETGIDIPTIHNNVYNAFTEGRARLFGYAINRKMEVIHNGTVAYMSLLESEMRRFQFQPGDSEGFVNYPLTIKSMKLSAIFVATHKFIRVSLRSRGGVDVDLFARKYFNGGGHRNAAGGKSFYDDAGNHRAFQTIRSRVCRPGRFGLGRYGRFPLAGFITAAKTLNFTKCAEQLYISQPAVSKHIGELESRYKVQLFERSGSRLALTEAGRVMLEHAERIADATAVCSTRWIFSPTGWAAN